MLTILIHNYSKLVAINFNSTFINNFDENDIHKKDNSFRVFKILCIYIYIYTRFLYSEHKTSKTLRELYFVWVFLKYY